MILSKIVDYSNLLESASYQQSCELALRALAETNFIVDNHEVKNPLLTDHLLHEKEQVELHLTLYHQKIQEIKAFVDRQIAAQESQYLRNSYDLWENHMYYENTESILQRRLAIDSVSDQRLRAKITTLSDWRYPGAIIRPGLENYVDSMVASDPLYVLDQGADLTNSAVSRFTQEYQRRLRVYKINDYLDRQTLAVLPDQQLSFVFAYAYFNFRPMEILKRYLEAVYTKLRPGGTFLFTFNDCDRAHGVALCEKNYMCYTPWRLIKPEIETLGYELVELYHGQGDLSWIEIRRPGELQTMRAAQTLAKIIAM